jgi:hypothetical protein
MAPPLYLIAAIERHILSLFYRLFCINGKHNSYITRFYLKSKVLLFASKKNQTKHILNAVHPSMHKINSGEFNCREKPSAI